MQFPKCFRTLVKAISLAFPCVVAAQDEQAQTAQPAHPLEEVHVTGVLRERSANELAQSITVIREQTLERISRSSLGETLAAQLGVSASSFTAGSSRPIIRGLAGARVRTMEDGLDTMDVSTVSVDHAVSIDPLVAEQIEIFRGPTSLLYGSAAVGGVINTITNRIPEFAPDDGFEGVFELKGDSVADSRSGLITLDGGNDNFAWHFDAVSRKTENYEIPGYADLDAAEEEHEEHEEEEHEEEHEDEDEHEHEEEHEEEVFGLLENSDLDGEAFSLGGSWLQDNGFFGVSVSGFDTNYGIPGHHHHEEEEAHEDDDHEDEDHDEDEDHEDEEDHDHDGEEEPVRVNLKQRRVDLKGGWFDLTRAIEAINLRFGVAEYEHVELEGEEVGTLFENDSWEGRLEFMHAPWGDWDGAYGVQFSQRQFSAVGAEAFVPPVDTTSYGAFIIEQRDFENWHVSLGGRLEYQEQKPSEGLPNVSDTATNVSLAGIRDFGDGYSFVVNAALADRLPVAEELYADGPHLATQTVEIGNPDLGVETSRHVDVGIRRTQGDMNWSLTAFLTDFTDFIYLDHSGEVDDHDELPIFNFAQRDADFTGIEAEFFTPIFVRGDAEVDLRLFADYVNGELSNGEYLPRMPPLRYGSRVQFHNDRFLAGLEVTVYDDQDDIAAIETRTEGYTMINADFTWTVETLGGTTFEVFVYGHNLADEDARRHTSFVKDTVPLPGRNVALGFRSHF